MSKMSTPDPALREAVKQLTAGLVDKCDLIEAGWLVMQAYIVPPETSSRQIADMRFAYMAGAQHLFSSIMALIGPGTEPTETDFRRLMLIKKELQAFGDEAAARIKRESKYRG